MTCPLSPCPFIDPSIKCNLYLGCFLYLFMELWKLIISYISKRVFKSVDLILWGGCVNETFVRVVFLGHLVIAVVFFSPHWLRGNTKWRKSIRNSVTIFIQYFFINYKCSTINNCIIYPIDVFIQPAKREWCHVILGTCRRPCGFWDPLTWSS